ncbi:MAG: NUDIX hydrolase [Muribaculaceae bacterium]|nr:NUDIX hydrolase [Muribaculaceae bacterium]
MSRENNSIEKWRTLSSEYLIRRPWLTARRDSVQLPDGRVNDEYYVLEYPNWVNVIAITDDGMFVMIEQYRHGIDEVIVELCAGVVEPGEDTETAARRELVEETGYTGGKWRLLNKICQNPSTCNNYTYCYLAEGVVKTSEQSLDATEDIAVKLMSEAEIRRMLENDEMKQAMMATPLWHYFSIKR